MYKSCMFKILINDDEMSIYIILLNIFNVLLKYSFEINKAKFEFSPLDL